MAQAKKGSHSKKSHPKKAHKSGGGHKSAHGLVTIPRGMMLVPTGGHRKGTKKKSGHRRPHKKNPEGHERLKNGAAAIGFGALAATAGMLGGYALSKAGMKSKWANVAANVATGAVVGGGLGMVDRAAGTVVAHNYFVAAGQWFNTDPAAGAAPTNSRRAGVSPQMMNNMHGLGDEQPDPEAISRPLPRPRAEMGLGSPLDHLGSVMADNLGEEMGGYEHLNGILADNLGEELEGYEHLNGILADNLGDDLEALDDTDGLDDGLR